MITTREKDRLAVRIADTRAEMGADAASYISSKIAEFINEKDEVNMIFAAAPSQNEVIAALLKHQVDWSKVNAFHMDEYVQLPATAPQGFANFLKDKIFDQVNFKSVNLLNGNADNLIEECKRYTNLLLQYPVDIVCLGIGENTHIAFNDPHVANFNDPEWVKVVDLDLACRQQQVNDGCFNNIAQVPTHALTLTIPALLKAKYAYCVVPGKTKAQAVYHTLTQEIDEKYPATSLRNHPNAILFTDLAAADLLIS